MAFHYRTSRFSNLTEIRILWWRHHRISKWLREHIFPFSLSERGHVGETLC